MNKLTKRQQEVLKLIQNKINLVGAPPTRAEIAQHMGFRSPNAAEDHLRALARKGIIELVPGTSRGIRLLKESGMPVIGHVAAGQPMLDDGNIEATYKIDNKLFKPNTADYLLRICGDSLKNIGIYSGDLLAVKATSEAKNGQLVIARIGKDITVKRFFRNEDSFYIKLKPENDNYQPLEIDIRTYPFAIEGIAVGIIRTNFNIN